ncbi:MAG: IS21 family transposase [Acidimicrobiia bacterium]|jgi:transposase|nr:IS21 family transposase [Acidimicrobiia bacterium]
MIAQEEYLVIHKLHALGYTITQIARELGLDRKTVRSHLARDHPPRYRRERRPSKLDPYRTWIRTRLEAAPLTATRLLRELGPLGYTGGYTILKSFVTQIRPKPPVPVVVRFETPPGDQGQADFARFVVTWAATGVTQVVWLFLVTLGYSRLLTGTWSLQGDLVAVLQGHAAAFTALGGAPRRMLYDRMKTAVTDSDAQGRPIFHPALLALAAHYGFTPEACRPYRAQTKGKIERPVGYIREDFWLGRTFWDLTDLIAQWSDWLATVANVRLHGTTGVRPVDRGAAEHLQPLPPTPHDPVLTIERQLSRDGCVAVRGNQYAVPLVHHRSPIEVRIHALTCELYVAGTWLATYALAPGRGARYGEPLALAPTAQWPHVPRPGRPAPPLPVLPPTLAWLRHDVERRDLAVYETVGAGR